MQRTCRKQASKQAKGGFFFFFTPRIAVASTVDVSICRAGSLFCESASEGTRLQHDFGAMERL